MPQQWDLVKRGQNGAVYIRQGNSSGAMVPRQPQEPVKFAAENGSRRFEYVGPDNSYVTELALGIAERLMNRRCQSYSYHLQTPGSYGRLTDGNTGDQADFGQMIGMGEA